MNSTQNYIRMVVIFVSTIIAQILILNDLRLGIFVNPYVYVLFIMSLPIGLGRNTALTLAFGTGLIVDLFSNTPGMHAAASTLIAFVRPKVLSVIALNSEYKADSMPTIHTYGPEWYMKYATIMISIHHVTLFFIEQFDAFALWTTLLRVVVSIAATLLIVVVVQPLLGKN